MTPDPEHVARIIEEVAVEEIVPRFRSLADHESWEKRPGSIVTVADHAAEDALIARLTGIVPGTVAVGEEGVHDDPAMLAHLDGEAPVWVIDAIDGTANFAAGRRPFAVMVAYVDRGETVMSWIHDPMVPRTIVAEAGGGAYAGDSRLHVAAPRPVAEMEGVLSGRLRRDPDFAARFARIHRARCVAEDYARLALAELDFAQYRSLRPWDHIPGVLIEREADGVALGLDGTPYRPTGAPMEQGLLMAPDPDSWHELATLILGEIARQEAPDRPTQTS